MKRNLKPELTLGLFGLAMALAWTPAPAHGKLPKNKAAPAKSSTPRPDRASSPSKVSKSTPKPAPTPLPTSGPLTQLREVNRVLNRSTSARELGVAWDRLKKGKFLEAIARAKTGEKDPTFSDYSLWIQGEAHFKLAQLQAEKKAWSQAIRSAQTARERWIRVDERQPYSSLTKLAARSASQAELLLGWIHHAQKNASLAKLEYQNGFQRLATNGNLGTLESKHILAHGEACKKIPDPLCEAWMFRLQSAFPKKAPEAATLSQIFEAPERPRPESSSREQKSYREVDLDQKAFEEAWNTWVQGKPADAQVKWEEFLSKFPLSAQKNRARFWLAQALAQGGTKEQAKAQEHWKQLLKDTPWSWYGILASMKLGRDYQDILRPDTVPTGKLDDAWLTPAERIRLKRAENFLAERQPELARQELRELRARENLSGEFLTWLAFLHQEAGNHLGAFQAAGELIQREAPQAFTPWMKELVFPTERWEQVKALAEQEGVDPLLVLSLMKQESAFSPDALSGSGANGLMQVMYATALDTEPTIDRVRLMKEDENLRIGVRYLKQLLNRFDGNYALALAGYNAGPTAAARWLRDFKGKGLLEYIESITYKETREYVASILRNYLWYSTRIEGKAPKKASSLSTLDPFWVEPNRKSAQAKDPLE